MKLITKKTILGGAIFLALNIANTQAATLCGAKTLDRQGEVPANQAQCITDYGHYLWVNIPYDNSDVTITTSGGTFNGRDADITLYQGSDWSGTEEAISKTVGTNDESISFVSRAGKRYFFISGDIAQTTLLANVSGGDIPPPMGDYIVYDTNILVDLPTPSISSKTEYAPVISDILAASYAGFKAIASQTPAPISDVSKAIHYLANADDLSDPDLNQLLYFMGSYKYNAAPMTDTEAAEFSTAMQAVAKMTNFLSATGGTIQEGYVRALNNFERGTGAQYFAEQLPHLLALIQYHSLQSDPFAASNAGNAMMESMIAIGSAALYGDAPTKAAFNNNMLDVLSVLRSFALLGETSVDMRWSTENDKKWIMPHTFNAMGKISSIATDEAKARFDSTILAVREKTIALLSKDSVEKIVTKNYLNSANRQCDANDALYGSCYVPPKIEDVLTVSFACTDKITIRAQSSISQTILDKSCQEMADEEAQFHTFFNTGGTPVTGDKNDTLEVIAFSSPDDYKKYAPEFFGISTDNGGMYLEGTPENVGNQARFIAMQCPDAWIGSSCQYSQQIYNLKHEFVHYLDGRYNKTGGFGAYDYNVSWSEGFAEYIANGSPYVRTLNSLKGKTIPPLYNLLFMAYGYDDLYQWSYFAMQYLSVEHPNEITTLAEALRAGDKTAYTEAMKGVATRTASGFQDYVLANSETVAPVAATIPAANTIGSCNLAQAYVRPIDANKTQLSITNTTATPVSLFWVSNINGKANFAKNYKTLNQGDSFVSSSWSETDRIMLTDNNMNCLGVASLEPTSNDFTIEANLVKDVVPEVIPAQDELGSCALAQPHLIGNSSNKFTITNTTDYPIRLFRVDNLKGTPIYTSGATEFTHGYGVLNKGESYSNDIWYADRRLMVTDVRLNCLAVGVLNNATANFTIDATTIANAKPVENIPAPNTIGSCDLMEKHLTGPFEADFSFTNTTTTPVRVYRVDNTTGKLSDSFGFTTLNQGETYDSATTWKWFGNRRAAITDNSGQCLGVAVMTEKDTINEYQITDALFNNVDPVDTDGDGVIDSLDAFPNDPTETTDSDGDGVGDNGDAFPNDASETVDTDGDGVGDNGDVFPTDANEWLDTDGDGIGDNSDPYPNDPTNTPPNTDCGAATLTSGKLTLAQDECVAGGRDTFYIWVDKDNTTLDISTSGGSGDVGIYFNRDTWATKANAQNSSTDTGSVHTLQVTANKGWRYITLNSNTQYSGVTFKVAETTITPPPVGTIANACASQGVYNYGSISSGQNICTGNGRNSYYIMLDSSVNSIDINTAHGNGAVSLYTGTSWPDATNNDFSSTIAGTTEQHITVNNPPTGWYYISVVSEGGDVSVQVDLN